MTTNFPEIPVQGINNPIITAITVNEDYVLKDHKRFIMNKDNKSTMIYYKFDTLSMVDQTNNEVRVVGLPFEFFLHFSFHDDKNIDKDHNIQISASEDDQGRCIINITMLNWWIDQGPQKYTDMVTNMKQILDCGNGVGVFMQLAINGSPNSGSLMYDAFIYSKVIDEEKEKEYEKDLHIGKDEEDDKESDDDKVIQFNKNKEAEPEIEEPELENTDQDNDDGPEIG